jgi:putative ABC transport system permease protein
MRELGIDPIVVGFATIATLATAIASGMVPALRASSVDPTRALGHQSRLSTTARAQGRLRSALAAAQLALALALLAGAGVLLVSFYRLQQVDLGFRVERVLTFEVSLPGVRYDAARRAAFQEELARRVETIAGVTTAGGTSHLPATGTRHSWPIAMDSGPLAGTSVRQPEQPEHRTVSGHFFAALEIPLLAGRVFDERDDASAPGRAVVSARFARLAFPGLPLDQVVGQRIRVFGRHKREIIGVVDDVALDVYGTPAGGVYSAHRQFADNRNWVLAQVVATDGPPEQLLGAVRAEIAAMDPELAVYRAAPMTEVVGRGSSRQRFALVLMATFAAVSLTLAVIGFYGVLAYSVRQRTPEIGIRIALGATAAQVRALILRQAALVLTGGLVAGLAGALVLGRGLSSLLFQVSPWDGRILLATASLLTVTGFVSAWLPARRASRIEARVAMQES